MRTEAAFAASLVQHQVTCLGSHKQGVASWYISSEKIGVVRFHKPLVDNQIRRLDEQQRQIYCTLRLDPVCLDQLACRMHLT